LPDSAFHIAAHQSKGSFMTILEVLQKYVGKSNPATEKNWFQFEIADATGFPITTIDALVVLKREFLSKAKAEGRPEPTDEQIAAEWERTHVAPRQPTPEEIAAEYAKKHPEEGPHMHIPSPYAGGPITVPLRPVSDETMANTMSVGQWKEAVRQVVREELEVFERTKNK
jgi:hypothetical protein